MSVMEIGRTLVKQFEGRLYKYLKSKEVFTQEDVIFIADVGTIISRLFEWMNIRDYTFEQPKIIGNEAKWKEYCNKLKGEA